MAGEVEKYMELEKKHKEVSERIIRLEEQFKAKKQVLTDLVKEIKDAGWDPNNLKQIIAQEEQKAATQLSEFEKEIQTASEQLSKIEA